MQTTREENAKVNAAVKVILDLFQERVEIALNNILTKNQKDSSTYSQSKFEEIIEKAVEKAIHKNNTK